MSEPKCLLCGKPAIDPSFKICNTCEDDLEFINVPGKDGLVVAQRRRKGSVGFHRTLKPRKP